jgi:hypothetical protein
VVSQRLTAPKKEGGSLVLTTAYGAYDGANRITSAAESVKVRVKKTDGGRTVVYV